MDKVAIIKDFFNEFYNHRCQELALFDRFCNDHVVYTGIAGVCIGKNELKDFLAKTALKAFPDITIDMNAFDISSKGIVTARFHNQATFCNPFVDRRDDMSYRTEAAKKFGEISPENQLIDASYDAIFSFSRGKISKMLLKNFQFVKGEGYLDLSILSGSSHQGSTEGKEYAKIIEQLSHQIYGDLTPKEMECIALSMIGLSAKQIGKYIGNTHRTIETYLFHAFSKVGVCSKKESIESAIESRTLHLWQTIANYLLYEKYRV